MVEPEFRPRKYYCTDPMAGAECRCGFKSMSGYRQHRNAVHIQPPRPACPHQHAFTEDHSTHGGSDTGQDAPDDTLQGSYYIPHPILDGSPCDAAGNFLNGDHPPIPDHPTNDTWEPFTSRGHFELADFIFRWNQMSGKQVDELMQVLGSFEEFKGHPPFSSDRHVHHTIDTISSTHEYEVWYHDPHELVRNQLANPEFTDNIDYSARQVFGEQGQCVWSDFMTGNWAWNQSNTLAKDPDCHGAMLVPIILGSDKTTVSVATGQNDFYPLYISTGNLHNNARRAHKESVSLVAFLCIPQSILGPYIANYPEQCLLACIAQNWCTADRAHLDDSPSGRRSHQHTKILMCRLLRYTAQAGWGIISGILPFTAYFPCADIHELLTPDILHQIIKGTFKDYIVAWVGEYFLITYGEKKAEQIWADIDRCIAAVPLFPGLQHFPQGRRFKQWTGDDSKALMKIFLPAIAGHVPERMLRAICYFLDFCYIVRHSSLDKADLDSLQTALEGFHNERTVFMDVGQFGAPNGLCSSLTESKHHKAVKEPWRCSSGWLPLGKFAIGLLDHPLLPPGVEPIDLDTNHSDLDFFLYRDDQDMEDAVVDEGGDEAEVIVQLAKKRVSSYPRRAQAIGEMIGTPSFHNLIRQFLHDQRNPGHAIPGCDMDISQCPDFNGKVDIFHSAVASFYAASDICGVNGMIHYTICVAPRHDCYPVILLHFSSVEYPCALVRWFSTIGDQPCPNTGMWMVEPELDDHREHLLSVVHLDTILRPVHLIPIYGSQFLDRDLTHTDSLIAFQAFYVNRFSDYHAFEISF
ncbi:hypothetical protein C8R48DRAFT_750879 [Suillus tomentosus]|nr:hypothetical protein C8R48DRAFT_750879 [Suillus tomentosus]